MNGRLVTGLNFYLVEGLTVAQNLEMLVNGALELKLDGRPIISGAASLMPVTSTTVGTVAGITGALEHTPPEPSWQFAQPHDATTTSVYEATMTVNERKGLPDVIGHIAVHSKDKPLAAAAGWHGRVGANAFESAGDFTTILVIPVQLVVRPS